MIKPKNISRAALKVKKNYAHKIVFCILRLLPRY